MQWDERKGTWGLFVRWTPIRSGEEPASQEDSKVPRLVPGSMQRRGRVKGTRDQLRPGYRDLVEDFLERTEQVGADELAKFIGVNPATIRRWRLMGVRKVTGVTLDRMVRYLA